MRLLSALVLFALATTVQAQLATPNPAGLTYGHVHLNVVDMDRHKEIWVDHFNGVVVENGRSERDTVSFRKIENSLKGSEK